MNVLATMVAVHRTVPTVLEATHVTAVMGTPSMLMAMIAMVCLIGKKLILTSLILNTTFPR